LTIGNFPGIILKKAREIHQKARETLKSGIDPLSIKTPAPYFKELPS
jgi:hypothetical protein